MNLAAKNYQAAGKDAISGLKPQIRQTINADSLGYDP